LPYMVSWGYGQDDDLHPDRVARGAEGDRTSLRSTASRGDPRGAGDLRGAARASVAAVVRDSRKWTGKRRGLRGLATGELEAGLVTFDTSGLLAALDRRDINHDRVMAVNRDDGGPFIVPVSILSEVSYFIERWFGATSLRVFIDDLVIGRYALDCGENDLRRIRALVQRYEDFPLGLADAAVIACAERHGGKVLTLDLRHFGAVAREGTITILP
jgi:predicted nucleic acid-binding protein